MFYVQRLKKHGYVELGKFASEGDAIRFIANISFIVMEFGEFYRCDDGYTYKVLYK